jgi:hypothetical protein
MTSTQLKIICFCRGSASVAILLLAGLAIPSSTRAQDVKCGQGIALQHIFESGASWSLCADISGIHGLHVSRTFFRAPGDLSRSVMAEGQLSQIMLHYHDDSIEEPQIVSPTTLNKSVEVSETFTLSHLNCDGQVPGTISEPNSLCERIKSNGILAKFDQHPSVQTEAWELSAAFTRQTLIWSISWTFTEDGQITPLQ